MENGCPTTAINNQYQITLSIYGDDVAKAIRGEIGSEDGGKNWSWNQQGKEYLPTTTAWRVFTS